MSHRWTSHQPSSALGKAGLAASLAVGSGLAPSPKGHIERARLLCAVIGERLGGAEVDKARFLTNYTSVLALTDVVFQCGSRVK